MSLIDLNIEWRGGKGSSRMSVFVDDEYIGEVGTELFGDEQLYTAKVAGVDTNRLFPALFTTRGEAVAALVKEMPTAKLARLIYVEV